MQTVSHLEQLLMIADGDTFDKRKQRSIDLWKSDKLYMMTGLTLEQRERLSWWWRYVSPPGFVVYRHDNAVSLTWPLLTKFRSRAWLTHFSWIREHWLRTNLPHIVVLDSDPLDHGIIDPVELVNWLYANTRSYWHGREIKIGLELSFRDRRDALLCYLTYSDFVCASVEAQ